MVLFFVANHSKVFGMASGMVLITDYHGNESRRLYSHSKAVTDLSMDIKGDFLARCVECPTMFGVEDYGGARNVYIGSLRKRQSTLV